MKRNNGFTLLELIISLLVIGLISLIATTSVLSQIPNFKINEDIKNVEQSIKLARSAAIKKSCTIKTDFSKALINHGENGGIIEIKDSNGNILNSVTLSHNVTLNSSLSTIQNYAVIFDYRGEPVDNNGLVSGFTSTNNTVAISYYDKSVAKVSKSLKVLPMTGNISK